MRNGRIGLVSAVALAGAMAMNGCKDSSSGGGAAAQAAVPVAAEDTQRRKLQRRCDGNGALWAAAEAPAIANRRCGRLLQRGALWWRRGRKLDVTSSCLTVTGALDLSLVVQAARPGRSRILQVTGTWTANTNEPIRTTPSRRVMSSSPWRLRAW